MKPIICLMILCVLVEVFAQSVPKRTTTTASTEVELFVLDTTVFDSIVCKQLQAQQKLRDFMYMKDPK